MRRALWADSGCGTASSADKRFNRCQDPSFMSFAVGGEILSAQPFSHSLHNVIHRPEPTQTFVTAGQHALLRSNELRAP